MSTVRQNSTQAPQPLNGFLDPSHTSTLNAFWIKHATPWPWVAGSVCLSIILGFIGAQATYSTWAPRKPKKGERLDYNTHNAAEELTQYYGGHYGPYTPPPKPQFRDRLGRVYDALEQPPTGLSYSDQRKFRKQKHQKMREQMEAEQWAKWVREGRVISEEHDNTVHAGYGWFAFSRTLLGVIFSTIRAAMTLALMINITMGHDAVYPGLIAIMVMFASIQTYLGTRAVPRITYLFIIADLIAVYACMCLAIYGWATRKTTSYQKFGLQGGNCPCMLYNIWLESENCAAYSLDDIGCAPLFSRSNDTSIFALPCPGPSEKEPYTRIDPNTLSKTFWAEVIVGGIGSLYGLAVLYYSMRWIPRIFKDRRKLFLPLSLKERQVMISRATGAASIAFCFLLATGILAIVMHYLDQTKAITGYYQDSFGPLGAATSWSDCFEVKTSVSKNGHFGEWWANKTGNRFYQIVAFI